MYSVILTDLVNRIYSVDGKKQLNLLYQYTQIGRYCDIKVLEKIKAFTVISNTYLKKFNSSLDTHPGLNIYQGNECKLYSKLVLPIWGFDGLIHSFLTYDDGKRDNGVVLTKDSYITYSTLNNINFEKGRYFLMLPDTIERAFKEKYIAIVDGTFDALNLNSLGIPTVALLSSNLTRYHREYLKFIPNWVVFADNDRAGTELFNYCKLFNNHCIRCVFDRKYKDIDDYIKENINLYDEDNIKSNKILEFIKRAKSTGFLINLELEG